MACVGPTPGYVHIDAAVPHGFLSYEVDQSRWIVPSRYQNLNLVASGTYGSVCKAYDVVRGNEVAIKKLARPFQDTEIGKRTYRELKLLSRFEHENVLDLLNVFTPDRSHHSLNDVYFVSTAMECSLADVLKSNHLRIDNVPFVIYQILRGLKYIHGAGIIHRDLKPQNIGFNNDTFDLKILDFGLARSTKASMTGYVTTRWYRAPEVILNWMQYNQTADVWSVGCIMGEMLLGKPVFPGSCSMDQLKRIVDLLGTPDEDFVAKMTCDNAKRYVRAMPKKKKRDFQSAFRRADSQAVDVLEAMLQFDPDVRPTAEMILTHPYFGIWRVTADEPHADPISMTEADTDVSGWKKLVWDTMSDIARQKAA